MRRFLTVLTTAGLLIACGCGGRSYEVRLTKTLEDMRYRKRLDDNLMPAPSKGKLEQNLIYVRPPKTLEATKEFLLTVLEPGRFDVTESFVEPDVQNLHVLGRVKKPKPAAGKKSAPAAADAAVRGEFNADVIELLNGVYGVELDATKAKAEGKKGNEFKRLTFEANGKNVQLYLYGPKGNPHEVALVFEYPKAQQSALVSKIELCLESFAVGERARRLYSGAETEEEPGEATGGGGPVAF